MKTIGLIGGMSWESTVSYYRQINEGVKARLGGLHSAKIILYSVDFAEIEHLQRRGEWDAAGEVLAAAAQALQGAGADFIVLCTNTMHKVAAAIEAAVDLPLLHIVDPTAHAIRAAGFTRVGLLGTRFTMDQPFFRERLQALHGIEVLVPDADDGARVDRVIFEELCLGRINDVSRQFYREVMQRLVERSAQGIILGCTEIALLVDAGDASVPQFDTAGLHADAAVAAALS